MKRLGVAVLGLVLVLGGCSGAAQPAATPAINSAAEVPALDKTGWTDSVYQQLTDTIQAGAGQGKVAVFDFDNTTQARDVSEATLAQAEQSGAIDPAEMPQVLFPRFTTADGKRIRIERGIYDYYDALLTTGESGDRYREYTTLSMPALVFEGRPVADYIRQTRAAYDQGSAVEDLTTGQESMIGPVRRPFIYPQMADLYGNLRAHGYDVWIVSAGITWGVRYMVEHALNPMITEKYGAEAALPADHVIAVSPLMRDTTTGQVVSDYELTHEVRDRAYLELDPERMRQLQILALSGGVTSWRGGKLAAIADVVTLDDFYFAAGDSDGDIAMLDTAPNRLTINRMERPDLARVFADQIASNPDGTWMLQPTLYTSHPGFLPNQCLMADRTAGDPVLTATTQESLAILESTGKLGSFTDC